MKLKSLKTLYDELLVAQDRGFVQVDSRNVKSSLLITVTINFTVPFETRIELLRHIQDKYNVTAWQKNLSIIEIHG